MKKHSFLSNVVSLAIGGIIGMAIALPARSPEIRHQLVHAWTDIRAAEEAFKANLDLACMILPESNANHGGTLEEVISGIRDEEYEYAAVFYGERKLFEVTDHEENRVTYSCLWLSSLAPDMIDLHNHPSIGYSFSYTDLDSLCRNQLSWTSIVASRNAIYTLSTSCGWPTRRELQSYFLVKFGIDFESGEEISASLLAGLERSGYIIVRSKRDGIGIGIGFTSKTISEFAEFFDLDYMVEYLPDEADIISGAITAPE